ncbi:class I SAM-dependent methyltransferase [Nonomuraea sp. NPDC050556]|uniref:class I SAM-dependent methyltransferase n=1 Tax=Nonomuraea sp. NPDC050556 TaxID=3364369 RepID=UPI0037A8DF80
MTFNHNDHYHRLLLRQVPSGARRALDVGCGTGRFARTLAERGLEVDAIDPATSGAGPGVRFLRGDAASMDLPAAHYDYISCLASLHHMPFETVTRLRASLAPGGVLVVLGCYPESTRSDYLLSLLAVPCNALMRLALSTRPAPEETAPVTPPKMTLPETRRAADQLLPGHTLRRLLFWRYLLIFRAT